MPTLKDTISRLRQSGRALAGQVAVVVARRAQSIAGGVVPRVESAVQRAEIAPSIERLGARRDAFRLAVAEYLLGSLSLVPDSLAAGAAQPPEAVLHLTRLVETRFEQLRRYREFWRAEDPVEAVHQLRVASRRLRAFVDLFAQFFDSRLVRRTEKQLKSITKAVRDLRDADVMVIDLEKRFARAQTDEERAALEHLTKKTLSRRDKLAKKAAARTKEFDLDALGVGLRRMLDELAIRARSPSATYELIARLTFDRTLDETRRSVPTFAHLPRPAELHAFRIRVKRLRYAAEFVEPVLGERFLPIQRGTKKIQEVLGDHQDRVVLCEVLEGHRDRVERSKSPELARGLDQLIMAVRSEREQLFQRFSTEYAQASRQQLFAR
jgi:CHAD domain-containing protein